MDSLQTAAPLARTVLPDGSVVETWNPEDFESFTSFQDYDPDNPGSVAPSDRRYPPDQWRVSIADVGPFVMVALEPVAVAA